MNTPLISVVMPCFNAEAYVKASIDCVLQQTYPSIELIVVDDGSTDESFAIIQATARENSCITAVKQPNRGPYPARNLALSKAKGDYVAFLDADDYWLTDCLEKLFGSLVENEADVSYCGWQNIVENGTDGPPYVPPAYQDNDIFQAFLKGCPWPIHAALVKRSVIEQIGGFSTRYFTSMDYDFWLRISAVTQNIARVPEVLAFYRWHQQGQISSVKWRQVLDAWRVKKEFIENHPNLLKHISERQQNELTDGYVLKQAYTAFWKRDLLSAQKLFRVCWKLKGIRLRDLKYILLSFLPGPLFQKLIHFADRT